DTHDKRHRPYDVWPLAVMMKVLTQHEEATADPRVVLALTRFLGWVRDNLDLYPLHSWSQFRWADSVLSVAWLFNRTGDEWLLALARRIHAAGYDWGGHFRDLRYRERTRLEFTLQTHVVNNAMGLKTSGVWFQFSGADQDRGNVGAALANLDRFHGQA